jgi:hypothetical protein
MPAQFLDVWSPASISAAHQGLLDFLDGESGAGSVTIHRSDDALLATIPLQSPGGSVNGANGQVTLLPDGREENAPAAGDANYATLRNSSGTAMRSMECVQGVSPVLNKCVLNTTTIELGGRVELVSAVIG